MRRMLAELFEDVARIDQRIAQVTREIEGLAARDDRAPADDHSRHRTAGGNGAARRHRRRPPVPAGARPRRMARPRAAGILDGRED
jgi:hypothetical protein